MTAAVTLTARHLQLMLHLKMHSSSCCCNHHTTSSDPATLDNSKPCRLAKPLPTPHTAAGWFPASANPKPPELSQSTTLSHHAAARQPHKPPRGYPWAQLCKLPHTKRNNRGTASPHTSSTYTGSCYTHPSASSLRMHTTYTWRPATSNPRKGKTGQSPTFATCTAR